MEELYHEMYKMKRVRTRKRLVKTYGEIKSIRDIDMVQKLNVSNLPQIAKFVQEMGLTIIFNPVV